MRTCPNCGEQYPDDDIRTMCGSCMTSLGPPGQPAAAVEPEPPPEPRPKPAPPPEPEPTPPPQPQAKPVTAIEPVVPRPAPPPRPQAPPRAPTAPAKPRGAGVRVTQVGAGANARAAAWGALALAAALVAVSLSLPALVSPFNPTLFTAALVSWGAVVWCVRQWSCYGWVRSATLAFPGRVRLGEKARAEITLVASRPFPVDRVVLSLVSRTMTQMRGEPRILTPTTHREISAASDFRLEANRAAAFEVECEIPPDAPASFVAYGVGVEWFLRLWVAIPGWHADVRESVRFRVAPYLAEPPAAPRAAPQPLPIMDLADCRAEIVIGRETAALDRSRAVLRTGAPTAVRLTLQPLRDIGAATVMARLDYRLRGKGEGDIATVFRAKIYDGSLAEGAPVSMDFTIPALNGPLTYASEVLTIDWWLSIEIHRRRQAVRRATLPITVLPGWEEADEMLRAVVAGE